MLVFTIKTSETPTSFEVLKELSIHCANDTERADEDKPRCVAFNDWGEVQLYSDRENIDLDQAVLVVDSVEVKNHFALLDRNNQHAAKPLKALVGPTGAGDLPVSSLPRYCVAINPTIKKAGGAVVQVAWAIYIMFCRDFAQQLKRGKLPDGSPKSGWKGSRLRSVRHERRDKKRPQDWREEISFQPNCP